jgi:hypothetical protein
MTAHRGFEGGGAAVAAVLTDDEAAGEVFEGGAVRLENLEERVSFKGRNAAIEGVAELKNALDA